MTTVPSNLVPTRISQLTEYTGTSQDGYLPYVLNGVTYKVQFANIAAVGAVPSSRTITGGGGLEGGGDLSANRVISIADGGVGYTQLATSGVVAGTYGDGANIPVLAVDDKGRVTTASTTPINLSSYVPTSRSVLAGVGLTGGGTLASNVTISLSLSASLPQPGGVAGPGTSDTAARDDHVHPAVDLSDTTETSGVLPMSRGGTGSSLSPAAGAILYSDGSETVLSGAGSSGQFFVSGGTAGPSWFDITGGATGLTFGFAGSDLVLGGTLNVASGGTGATTAADARVNLLPSYAGNGGRVLTLNPSATDVVWQAISGLGTVTSVDVSGGTTGITATGGPITGAGTITLGGTLLTTNGGTGLDTYSAGDMLYYSAGDALTKLSLGSNTYLLSSDGTSPAWADPTTVTVGNATNAVVAANLIDGSAGSIPYQTGTDTTAMLAAGTGVLVGGTTPTYSTTPTLTGTNFTGVPNSALDNSSLTIGTTNVALGATALTLGGLTSVAVTQDPTSAFELATKQYVDTLTSSGLHYHEPVKYAAASPLTATYNNGAAGVGATLTNAGTLAAFTPDGVVASVGDRVLIYQQAAAAHNGVYEVTVVGNGATAWVLTRTTDADTYGPTNPNALGGGDAFFVSSGNTGAGETYVCNTEGVITFGTTAITFAQISDTAVYSAGTGLTLIGTQFSLTAPVAVSLGGTGQTTYTDGQLLIGTTAGSLAKSTLTAGTGVSVTNGDGSITIANTAPDQVVAISGGTGISATGTYPNFTITNTAPDQVVAISGGTGISTGGTYPNFTVTNTAPDQVVSITGGTNISVTGTYPNFTVSSAGGGTVTSVSGTGTVNGISLSGTVTSSGSLTLSGTLSGVDLTTAVTGVLPVANGGTGTSTALTAGSVVFAGAAGTYTQDNANFFWDDSNNRLGIKTATPSSPLTVAGTIESTTGGVKFPDGTTQTSAGINTGKAIAMALIFGG